MRPPLESTQCHHHGRLDRIADLAGQATRACYSGVRLACACGVSLRHLQRHIHREHGGTLSGWLNTMRLVHGYQRLSQGCSVKETAYSLGFKQVSHFSRCFKGRYGISPSTVPIDGGPRVSPLNLSAPLALTVPVPGLPPDARTGHPVRGA